MELWFSEFHTPDVKHSLRVNRHLYSKKSDYQQIDIYDTPEFGKVLTLDGNVMLTERDEFIYDEMITHVPMAVHHNVQDVLVIGAGDGGVVKELADLAVVTSDNPRTEDPEDIIRDILAGMEGEGAQIHVEPDRRQAIAWALSQGRPGDVIVLAGKGHETYQEIQGVQYPMDEREIVAQYFSSAPSWERTGNLPAGVV